MIVIALKHPSLIDQYVPNLVALAQPAPLLKPSVGCLRFVAREDAEAWLASHYGKILAALWPGLTPEVVEVEEDRS